MDELTGFGHKLLNENGLLVYIASEFFSCEVMFCISLSACFFYN